MLKLFQDDSGISEIVGALILILIVVIAAAGLAMIISQAETQQASRQAHDAAVSNEKLVITSMVPTYDTSSGKLISLALNIQNLNVDDSSLAIVEVNNAPAANITSGGRIYDYNNQLVIPGFSNITVNIYTKDFIDPLILDHSSPITVQLVSSFANYFTSTITPPTAVAKFSVETENLGLVQRDYVMLDASDSSGDKGQIKLYSWDIKDTSNWTNEIPNGPIETSGTKIRFSPQSKGPFIVTLTVKTDQNDSHAMIGKTDEMEIPSDPNFSPPLSLKSIYYQSNTTIVATLKDASGNPCPGEAIVFQAGSNIQADPTMNITDLNGSAKANVSFIGASTGTVTISYDKLINNIVVSASSSPPNADFKADTQTGFAPLHVQFADLSSTPTGSIISRQWNFGDGTSNDTSPSPSHIFTAAGTYTITLTVNNSDGLSDTEQKSAYIMPYSGTLAADFTSDLTNWILTSTSPLDVQFTDASSGNINSRQWSFGGSGGNDTAQNPIRALPFNGGTGTMTFPVVLTVYNSSGSNNSILHNIIINPHAPIADFVSNETSPLTVEFSAGSMTGTSPGYFWDFGDGSNITVYNPVYTYTYATNGTYTVKLNVTNAYGSDTCQKLINV